MTEQAARDLPATRRIRRLASRAALVDAVGIVGVTVLRPTRRRLLLIGTLATAMTVAGLSVVPASAATDYTDGYAICSQLFVDGVNGADNRNFVIQFGRSQHPGICAAEQKAIDSIIAFRGVPNTTEQRNRVVEFGRGEVAAVILSELVDIIERQHAGDPLQPWESDAYGWYQQRVVDATLAAVKLAQAEYQDWGNDACNYTPPAPYTYDPYTGGTCSGATMLNGLFTGGPTPPTYQDFLTYGLTRYGDAVAPKLGSLANLALTDLALLEGVIQGGSAVISLSAAVATSGLADVIFPIALSTPTFGIAAIGPGIAAALLVAGIVRGIQVVTAGEIGTKLDEEESALQTIANDPDLVSEIDLSIMLSDQYDSQRMLGAFTTALAPVPGPSASAVTAATPDPSASSPWFQITDGTTTNLTQKILFASSTPTNSHVRANYQAWLDHNWWIVQEVSSADGSPLVRTLTPTLPVYVADGVQANVGYVPGSGFALGEPSTDGSNTSYPVSTAFTFKAPPGGDISDLGLTNTADVTASLYDRPFVTDLSNSSTSPAEGGTFTVSGTYHDPAGSTGSVKLLVPGASRSQSGLADGDTFSLSVTLLDAGSDVSATLSASDADGRKAVDTTYQLDVSDPVPTDLSVAFVNTAQDGNGPEVGKPLEAELTFNDVPTDTTHFYSIDWGDGTNSTGRFDSATPPTHTYTASGPYVLVVSISDEEGATASIVASVTVSKLSQSITVTQDAPASAVYGTSFTVAATADSDLPVAYASSGACANSGKTFTMTSGTGTCTVTFTQDGNADYGAAAPVSETVDAVKADQAITFETLPEKRYGDASFDISTDASASSGLPVDFTSTTPGVCTLSGSTVTIMAAGTCTIMASQVGDADYNPADSVSRSFTVTPAPLTITASSPTGAAYGDPAPTITPGYSGFVNGDGPSSLADTPTCSTTYTKGDVPGHYRTSCSGASDPNYSFTYVDGVLVVGKAPLTVTALDHTVQYSDPLPQLTVSYNGFVLGQDPAVLSGTLSCSTTADVGASGQVLSPAGPYEIDCSGLSSADYVITYQAGTLAVTREDTVARLAQDNPHAVAVDTSGKNNGNAPAMTFTAHIAEVADGSYGDIGHSIPVTVSLEPVGPGSTITCTVPSDGSVTKIQPATSTDPGFELVSCTVPAGTPINVYEVTLTVGGSYYQGSDDSVLTVYDPTAGGSNGAGIIRNPNTTYSADIAYTVSYLKNGQVQGRFLYISHDANGNVVNVLKGNKMASLAIYGSTAWVTGKATLDGVGNYSYIITGIDNGSFATYDQFGLIVTDGSGHPVPDLIFDPVDVSNGNIYVGT